MKSVIKHTEGERERARGGISTRLNKTNCETKQNDKEIKPLPTWVGHTKSASWTNKTYWINTAAVPTRDHKPAAARVHGTRRLDRAWHPWRGAALICPQACLYVSKSALQFAWGGDKSYLRDLIKFLIYTPINSPGLLAMCLKLYLPKDSLLSIDQGPGSHKLWEHVCGWGSGVGGV